MLLALLAGLAPSLSPLTALRAATGCTAWQTVRALRIAGSHVGDGLDGPFSETDDVRSGRSVQTVHAGPFVAQAGFDGSVAWVRDFSGASHPLDGAHARALATTNAWLVRRGWCATSDGTAYRANGVRRVAARAFDALSATPRDGAPLTMWLDRSTHLIARIEQRLNESDLVTTFDDWRTVANVAYPFETTLTYPQDEDAESYRVREAVVARAPPAGAFAQPPLPHDVRFAGRTHRVRVPYVVEGEKPIVDVTIDGIGPFPFVLDTGGHFILTPATARRLHLAGIGHAYEVGAGDAVRTTRFAQVHSIRIGDAVVLDQPAEIIPYGFRRLERGPRPPKAGWLGLSLFERFATTFDPATRTVAFAALGDPRPRPRGLRLPLTFDEDAPFVACTIDGRAGPCMIDTGNAGETIVEGAWAARNGLPARLLRGGVTIDDDLTIGRADVTMGAIRLPHEPIEYSPPARRGSEATTVEAAILSEGLLDRFAMTIDYGRHALYLAPVPHATPRPFDRSGAEVDKELDGTFRVRRVLPASPAAAAGLRAGDRIVAVDGTPSSRLARTDFYDRSLGPIGTRVTYRVVRDRHATLVTIRLRELLP